ncbi:hypothetical protein [Vibrio fluvialis]|uniref:hypothetical protein n=1 Tax=Vibrio fluvialis TaxID=676 RepID=UPI001F346180|nr:hypothetical protein [Vibrio fluvialis]MCE7656876.1 hypothetical protein [Vibrio fluvialis]
MAVTMLKAMECGVPDSLLAMSIRERMVIGSSEEGAYISKSDISLQPSEVQTT